MITTRSTLEHRPGLLVEAAFSPLGIFKRRGRRFYSDLK
jgi:hypothetical protein